MIEVQFSKNFQKLYKKSDQKIKNSFQKKLALFFKDPHSAQLRNHHLTGEYKQYRSINVTGDWRALYRDLDKGKVAFFDILGTHSQLYK